MRSMARYSQRPENALKRANEFIEVGKPERALDTLYEVFRNKKWAYSWSESVLEPIMLKYLDLCVELKKSHIAKEGLFQYRNMFQSVNVGSLESVIRCYLRTAEERTESAREHSHQAVIDIDDLDNLATPESILLSAVSGEGAQERSDRTILTPWVKFLWESYCQCLELLRTNAHVETLYHDIARMAYQFCLKYNRKTEFRKLCDKLRKHLEDIAKLPVQTNNVSLGRAETQQLNLETRLIQLEYAIQMELWQEAYKATEDIHNLMTLSKKPPIPKTMANYYQKLAMVFWKAGPPYYLFHAAALLKLLQLNKDLKKNITQEEIQKMASRVLLSTLSIPFPSAHPEFDRFIETDKSPLEKAQKLSVLLTMQQPPTRSSLLKDLVRFNVISLATPPIQELYTLLEVNFNPLQLCHKVDNIIKELKDVDQYIQPLRDVTLVILIRQVAQVYDTISYARLLQLANFASSFHMEKLLVECVRQNDMQIRIDHEKSCIQFGADLSESQREDKLEGPSVQNMPSEQIRTQLLNMSDVLTKCLYVINPNHGKDERDSLHAAMVKHYHENKIIEHQRVLARHKIIEERKEYLEQMNTVRELEEAKRAEELARQQALAEQKRMEIEREERERKRQENELQQIKDRTLREKMHQISQTAHGQKILKNLQEDELKTLDAEKIAAREAEELQKERRELQQKLRIQEKKIDYFERAKRIEEIPLLKQAWKDKQVTDRKFWDQQEVDRIEQLKQERALALEHRERLARIAPDRDIFLAKLKTERSAVYKEELRAFEKKLDEIRKERLEERRLARIEERRAAWIKRCEEEAEMRRIEEQKAREDEEQRRKEEEQRIKAQEEAKRAEEERKRREKLDKQAEIQRQREEEAARKMKINQPEDPPARTDRDSLHRVTWRKSDDGGRIKDDERSSWRAKEDVRKKDDEWERPRTREGINRGAGLDKETPRGSERPFRDGTERERSKLETSEDRPRRPPYDKESSGRPVFSRRDEPSRGLFGKDRNEQYDDERNRGRFERKDDRFTRNREPGNERRFIDSSNTRSWRDIQDDKKSEDRSNATDDDKGRPQTSWRNKDSTPIQRQSQPVDNRKPEDRRRTLDDKNSTPSRQSDETWKTVTGRR